MRQIKITKTITQRSDNLERYLVSISKLPTVTPDEETELAYRIQKGDQKALDRLVEANLRFVVSVAKQYITPAMDLGDLITEGNIGLITAARKFDPSRGFKFISYAVWWIRQSIIQALADKKRMVRIPSNRNQELRDIYKASVEFEQMNHRDPTESELAELTGFTMERVNELMMIDTPVFSLEKPLQQDNDNGGSLLEFIPVEEEDTTRQQSLKADLTSCLQCLSPRERSIVSLFYGLSGGQELSLYEISCRMDLTSERVRQIKEKAIKKLRNQPQVLTLLRGYCG